MTLATRGLGPSNTLVTSGLGPYAAYLIPEEPGDIGTGGAKFQGYQVVPRRIWLKRDKEEPSLRLADIEPKLIEQALSETTEMIIDDEVYLVTGAIDEPTPKQALALLPESELEAKLQAVKKELGVTKALARKALQQRAEKEIKASRELKMKLVKDDEELALIIILSEV